jgi:hypothetical protein
MITPASLRIGNIISVCYEEKFEPHTVEILQADLVHLSDRAEADDPRDLTGLPVTKEFLLLNDFRVMRMSNRFISNCDKNFICIQFDDEKDYLVLTINRSSYTLLFIHELQNILFYCTGLELKNSLQRPVTLQ